MSRKLKKGMLVVLIANIISLFFNLLTNFILPKFLSVESYSAIKTFQLYITYIGLLHFGYEDGVYLKYGGKDISKLDKRDVRENIFTLRVFQIAITLLMIVVALILRDSIFFAFSIAILPVNMVAYFRLLFQAVGEFSKYGRIMNISSICTFIINGTLVFIIKTDAYPAFLTAYVIWDIILWVILEAAIRMLFPFDGDKVNFSWTEFSSNIRRGIPLTLGNFSSVLLTTIDRWFVKFLLTTLDFAQYSFAVSTESFINVALTPITVTLYNYFCKDQSAESIHRMRRRIIVFATYIVSSAFGAKFILEHFIQKYLGASGVLFYLFASQITFVVVKGIYVNLYKAQKRQKEYFMKLLLIVVIGVIYNAMLYFVVQIKEAFAIGTLLSGFTWLIICSKDHINYKISLNEYIYMIISTVTFIVLGNCAEAIVGFVGYTVIVTVAAWILLKEEIMYFISYAKNLFEKMRKRI